MVEVVFGLHFLSLFIFFPELSVDISFCFSPPSFLSPSCFPFFWKKHVARLYESTRRRRARGEGERCSYGERLDKRVGFFGFWILDFGIDVFCG